MLASCIMPTRGRRPFVSRAIANFLHQQGAEQLELLILDDGPDPVADLIPAHPRIRYTHSTQTLSLGSKRNQLCREAHGAIILHWDDDDLYATDRVRKQLDALRDPQLVVCGSSAIYYYDPRGCEAFLYRYVGRDAYVTGNTLAYRRAYWQRRPFADVQVGEDTRFVLGVPAGGVLDLRDPALCVATLHADNVSPKRTSGRAWTRVSAGLVEPMIDARGRPEQGATNAEPLVSCIMPTANRRPLIPITLALFRAQDYARRELIVVDDGVEPVGDLCEGLPGVRYQRVPRPTSIGERRNLACELARGDVVVHWDDDDWYGADRLRLQVEPLLQGRADVTGLETRHLLRLHDQSFWSLSPGLHRRMFRGNVHGGTLAYRRRYRALGAVYPDVNLAEDAALLQHLLRLGARLERITAHQSFVYVRHDRNAWRFVPGRFLDPAGWQQSVRPAYMPASAVADYRAAWGLEVVESSPLASSEVKLEAAELDCLRATTLRPQDPIRCDRCVVLVATDAYAQLLDVALGSLARFGRIDDAERVVLLVEDAPRAERVAMRHGARIVKVRSARSHRPAVKAALYSVAALVHARQYLCLDADVVVTASLAPLFALHGELPAGRILVAREACTRPVNTLAEALVQIYRASPMELAMLTGTDQEIASYPLVANDGVWVSDRAALQQLDANLRAAPELASWVHARADVWWRAKAAFNIALARLACGVELDSCFNVQLHVERAQPRSTRGESIASWRGRPAAILHFNGAGRATHHQWSRRVLAPAKPGVSLTSAER
jgi:glycosyltransferase involved in cell wall biosynthesis